MRSFLLLTYLLTAAAIAPLPCYAMHIAEGFLPKEHALLWFVAVAPVLVIGIKRINAVIARYPERKMLLGLVAAFIFVLSALKIPSVAGSNSHPTGVALSAILFGPGVSSVLSAIVLIFQALLLAHGGISTLGANTFSMGVAGGVTAWAVYKLSLKVMPEKAAVFLAALLGDWLTYVVTAGQLAASFPDAVSGFWGAFVKFLSVFAITQLPLAIVEGIITVAIYSALVRYGDQGLIEVWWRERRTKL